MDVDIRLYMDLQRLGPGGGERLQVEVGTGHHQVGVTVECRRGAPRERHDVRTEGEVRHEMCVHDVQMQRVRARRRGPADFVAKTPEIGGEKRRQYLDFHAPIIVELRSALKTFSILKSGVIRKILRAMQSDAYGPSSENFSAPGWTCAARTPRNSNSL